MRFLGLVSYLTSSVDHFAENSSAMYDVLKGTGFSTLRRHEQKLIIPDWDKRYRVALRESWRILKDTLSALESLTPPTRAVKKKVMTDERAYGLGGFLLQQGDDEFRNPVSFASRKLKKAELVYPVNEKECLAVVHAKKK